MVRSPSRIGVSSVGVSSVRLLYNWWAFGLRAFAGGALAVAVLMQLPRPTLAALIMMFAAYAAADGIIAIVAGMSATRRSENCYSLVFEGAANLALAGSVLIWPAMAAITFVYLTSVWAVATGAFLLAAARRLEVTHGRLLLALAGVVSATWGALAAGWGPSSADTPETVGWWLIGYALPFAAILLALAGLLQKHGQKDSGTGGQPERKVVA